MNWFWSVFLKGLATVLPILITIYVLYWLSVSSEQFLSGVLHYIWPDAQYWPGMGIAVAFLLIFFTGVLVNNRVGQFFLDLMQSMVTRIPVAKTIYNSVQDLMRFLANSGNKEGMDQVVEVYLSDHVRLVGFVTQQKPVIPLNATEDDDLVGVFIPVSYQIGGYTVYVPRHKIKPVNMSVENAMRLTLTAGMAGGDDRKKPGTNETDVQ